MILLELFWSFFQIGLLSIGGGYAALPMIQNEIVDHQGWLSLSEFADLIVITEMTPGPIILNSATFVGNQTAGLLGAVIATIGCITGPSFIVSFIAYLYFKYKELPVVKSILYMLRPAVVALIASAGVSIFILTLFGEKGTSFVFENSNYISVCLFILAFLILRRYKVNPIIVMLCCGGLGGVLYTFFGS
jgi:chromate transporter